MELWLKVELEEKEKKARECLRFLLLSMSCESRKIEVLKTISSAEK